MSVMRADSSVWLQYAAFEEIDTKDYERTRDVYKAAVKLVPHKEFTFAKVRLAPETQLTFSSGYHMRTSRSEGRMSRQLAKS
jgi:hypothetical protein